MTLTGRRLGPYEIVAPVGEGGMGEVYRARDVRLGRDVAVKVLPPHLAFDEEARLRFDREARAVAALSHPNILAIHDVGTEGATTYAVTELLEGHTLRARLTGALPPRKALEIALQIARGLAAAHDKGIVHRDLKPENVFITADGHVKILDFGLALAATRPADTVDPATALHVTVPGTIVGTMGYMSPEQVKGERIDHRTDIFSFGCVLYEIVTGRPAFLRGTAAETMSAVLRDDLPDPAGGAPHMPAPVEAIVRHSVEKRPEERFQSAHDLAFAVQAAIGSFSSAPTAAVAHQAIPTRSRTLWTAATIAIAAATGLAVWWLARTLAPPHTTPIRAVLPLPAFALPTVVERDDLTMAVSPDGRLLAYVRPTHSAIVLRDLETGNTRTLVEGGLVGEPFFSPDSGSVGFVQGTGGAVRTGIGGAIKKIALSGGAATVVVDGITGIKGATWGDDGFIYYSPAPSSGLWRAPAAGGPPEKLTDPDAAHGEKTHRRPFVLPGSRAVLFVVGTSRITSFDDAHIEVLRLSDRSRHRLVDGGTAPQFLATGHLLYERNGQLLAIKFDPDRLTIQGAPVIVADGVQDLPQAGVSYDAISADGTLLFGRRSPPPAGTIVAVDREGRAVKLADVPFAVWTGSLSPDGRLLAIDPDGATQQIAIVDLTRNTMERLTYEWDNGYPVWTPDASRLIFRSDAGGGTRRLFWRAADGSGVAEPLTQGTKEEMPTSISGRLLAYEDLDPVTKTDLWVMSLDDRKPRVLVRTPFDETFARFSPDGQWVAYQSNQSGEWEVYVQPYPASGRRQQVSEGGGVRPLWDPDARSLTYLRGGDVMTVTVVPVPGAPHKLFTLEPNDLLLDVMHDGRFVVLRRTAPPASPSLDLIVNWFDVVRRRAGS